MADGLNLYSSRAITRRSIIVNGSQHEVVEIEATSKGGTSHEPSSSSARASENLRTSMELYLRGSKVLHMPARSGRRRKP